MRTASALIVLCSVVAAREAGAQEAPDIDRSIVREQDAGRAPQITTAELREVLARGEAVVLDARPAEEFGISHIAGAVNVSQKPGTPMSLYISDVAEVMRIVPDRSRALVVYCNGPFCGKSRRFAEELLAAGYRNVRRYQLGMPGWRTMGGAAVIESEQLLTVKSLDRTAVFVDAGLTRPWPSGAVRIPLNEVLAAKDDGRLPMHDHNTRIVVIGTSGAQARAVAEAIMANAFHNVTYFDGSADELHASSVSSAEESAVNVVMRDRETALAACDTAAVLRLFAADAIVVTSSGRVLIGKEQLHDWVKDQVTRGQREHAGVRQVEGNKTSWAATVVRADWQKLGVSPLDVRQDAVVEGGKIRFFNTTLTPESAEKLRAAREGPAVKRDESDPTSRGGQR